MNERVSELGYGLGLDIHHIERRGMGGGDSMDRIENLIALTREQHITLGDKKQHKSLLFNAHRDFLLNRGIEFDDQWIIKQIEKCER